MDSLPRIVGTAEVPETKARKRPSGGRKLSGTRAAFAREVLSKLQPDQALVIEFPDPVERRLCALMLHNVNRYSSTRQHVPVQTQADGRRLKVWLRRDQQMALF